jgi:hypothetical protein
MQSSVEDWHTAKIGVHEKLEMRLMQETPAKLACPISGRGNHT